MENNLHNPLGVYEIFASYMPGFITLSQKCNKLITPLKNIFQSDPEAFLESYLI